MVINYNCNLNDDEFQYTVNLLVKNFEFEEIIETGTFNGRGSTSVFAETGKGVQTIECSQENWIAAKNYLTKYPNVNCIWGLSLPRKEALEFIDKDSRDFQLNPGFDKSRIITDSDNPASFYTGEVNVYCPNENVLPGLISNEKPQLIFLDSSGGVGLMEVELVLSLPEKFLKHKILLLDDVGHVKHFRSAQRLKESGFMFITSLSGRFGYSPLAYRK